MHVTSTTMFNISRPVKRVDTPSTNSFPAAGIICFLASLPTPHLQLQSRKSVRKIKVAGGSKKHTGMGKKQMGQSSFGSGSLNRDTLRARCLQSFLCFGQCFF
jgi:hypothetical protein